MSTVKKKAESWEDIMKYIRYVPMLWFEVFGKIVTKGGKLITPEPNYVQKLIGEAVEFQQSKGLPVRLVVLKPRQKGCSTGSMAQLYTKLRGSFAKCFILGDKLKSAENLLNIAKNYAKHDNYDWDNQIRPKHVEITCTNGSTITIGTAEDPNAGRSGTFQVLLATEAGRYAKTGVCDGEKVLNGAIECVGDTPETMIIIESTPNGASGIFYDYYQGAVTLDEARAGLRGNGYIKIFAPWYKFEETKLFITPNEEIDIINTLTNKERDLVKFHGVTMGQLEWRRRKIKKFGSDEYFDQEEPTDDVTCWLSSGRPRFNMKAVAKMMEIANGVQPKYGILSDPKIKSIRPSFHIGDPEPSKNWFMVYETPVEGCSYIVTVDTAKGEEQTKGSDPDCHAVLVLRKGYKDVQTNRWNPTKVVARISPPDRTDPDILADRVSKASRFYGDCLTVVENNAYGMTVLYYLEDLGVPLYHTEVHNKNVNVETRRRNLGWDTNRFSRERCLQVLNTYIRENIENFREFSEEDDGTIVYTGDGGIDIPDKHILHELGTFVVTSSGKAQARSGEHDDDVMALAFGLCCLEQATVYRQPLTRRRLELDGMGDAGEMASHGAGSYRV